MADQEPVASDSAEEIMAGTYRALCDHGFAALTMQDIADECGKSKSLLHYHYNTKEDLLVSFIEYIVDDFESRVEMAATAPPDERLLEFIEWFAFDPNERERQSFHIALLELRTQAPFNERYRAQLQRSDDLLRDTVADILATGIDEGYFVDVDVDRTASLIVAALDGARTRQITLRDETYTRVVTDALLEQLVEPILTDASSILDGGDDPE
ncbi:TetR/AcrR family transcriptional regulator [Haloferacaceae archaeon DSL9]